MNGIVFILVSFCAVILIVSIIYIFRTTLHKERMALIAMGKDPFAFDQRLLMSVLKWAYLFSGLGLGFLSAFLLDNWLIKTNSGGEALYPSMILIGGAVGLFLFYKLANNKLKKRKDGD